MSQAKRVECARRIIPVKIYAANGSLPHNCGITTFWPHRHLCFQHLQHWLDQYGHLYRRYKTQHEIISVKHSPAYSWSVEHRIWACTGQTAYLRQTGLSRHCLYSTLHSYRAVIWVKQSNSLHCADVPLSSYSRTHSLIWSAAVTTSCLWSRCWQPCCHLPSNVVYLPSGNLMQISVCFFAHVSNCLVNCNIVQYCQDDQQQPSLVFGTK